MSGGPSRFIAIVSSHMKKCAFAIVACFSPARSSTAAGETSTAAETTEAASAATTKTAPAAPPTASAT